MQANFKLRNGPRSIPPLERKGKNGYKRSTSATINDPETPLFFYIMYCKGFAKIGITETPKLRLSGLQCGNPFAIELLFAVPLERDLAIQAEKDVMAQLNHVHAFGDWFKVSKLQVKYVAISVVAKASQTDVSSVELRHRGFASIVPGTKRKIVGPNGEVFNSVAGAAKFLGISRQAMHKRVDKGTDGWKRAEIHDP